MSHNVIEGVNVENQYFSLAYGTCRGKAIETRAASTSQMGRFETELLATDVNVEALADMNGVWIDTSLVGQSMGGRSVLGFAAAYPERVNALVMSGTTGGYRDSELDEVRAAAPDLGPRSALAPSYAARDPEGAFLYRMIGRTNQFLSEDDEDAPAVQAPVPDIERIMAAGVPTLFLVGERDTVAAPTVTKAMQAKMTGSKLVTFPESGHSPYWEVHEEFNRVVLEFLRT